MGGGVYPCPNFLALFLEVHFWSIKRVYFFKNANVLNFYLFFRLLIYLLPIPNFLQTSFFVSLPLNRGTLNNSMSGNFDVRKKRTKLPKLGSGGWFGQCLKEKFFFFQFMSSLTTFPLFAKNQNVLRVETILQAGIVIETKKCQHTCNSLQSSSTRSMLN